MAPGKTGGDWTFHVFDKHDHVGTYEQRLWWLGRSRPKHPRVQRVVTLPIHDEAALEAAEARYLAAGYEGAILRSPDALYKYGRGTTTKGDLLKLKRFIDFEAEVIGTYEEMKNNNPKITNELGRGQRATVAANKTPKGSLGGLVLRAINGPHAGVEFRCGSGFSAEDRAILWGADLIGSVHKIKSFPVGTKDAPRHPIWLGSRDMEVDG
jgi:DNA ligase-1